MVNESRNKDYVLQSRSTKHTIPNDFLLRYEFYYGSREEVSFMCLSIYHANESVKLFDYNFGS